MAAEMFLGLPLFPGASEHDLLVRIVDMLGMPPDHVLQKALHTNRYRPALYTLISRHNSLFCSFYHAAEAFVNTCVIAHVCTKPTYSRCVLVLWFSVLLPISSETPAVQPVHL